MLVTDRNQVLDTLPEPTAAASARSLKLQHLIGQRLQNSPYHWMGFDEFMRMALYEPSLGYYAASEQPIGHWGHDGSDFVTAPEMTSLFGLTIAQPIAQVLRLSAPRVLEFGAGTGKLAADVLNALGDTCDEYWIMEVSAAMQARQRETLQRLSPDHCHKVRWLTTLPTSFSGCMLGNEVLDAMPVKCAEKSAAGWLERGVCLDSAGQFTWALRPLIDVPACLPGSVNESYLTEFSPTVEGFVHTLAQCLERGAALFLDYGFPQRELYHPQRSQGTLMCHYRHRAHDNPLIYVGLQDITAHVNFTVVAEAALQGGAEHEGYTTQARFLMNCGITQHLAALPELQRWREAAAAQKLLSEAEMGELFKVIGFSKGLSEPMLGFGAGDRSHTLDQGT
jgi:SAM-dependent MidA family methyltransferase